MSETTSSPSLGKIIAWVGGVLLVLMVLGWMFGWIGVPFRTTSAENVREQWSFAYRYEASLEASARNVCSARTAVAQATSDQEQVQRRSQALAYEQNYSRVQSEYDGRLRNAFEAKLVRPRDVPAEAPDLDQMLQRIRCS